MKTSILLATLALATTHLTYAGGEGWLTNYAEAKKKAAAENKDLLVDFTGSDWCHWCIKLSEEVFSKESFSKGAADQFILLELDYPNDKSKQDEALQKQNAELMEKFQIQGFPTILLLDSKGLPYAQTGYQQGGPEPYLAHLDELKQVRTQRDESLATAEKLEGVEKAKALFKAISALPAPLQHHYQDISNQIIKLDPNDETGLSAQQKLGAALNSLHEKFGTHLNSGEFDEAATLIDDFLKTNPLEGAELQGVLGMKMDPILAAQKFDKAEALLEKIIQIDPNSEIGKFAENFRPQLAQMKNAGSSLPPKAEDTTPAPTEKPLGEAKKTE